MKRDRQKGDFVPVNELMYATHHCNLQLSLHSFCLLFRESLPSLGLPIE